MRHGVEEEWCRRNVPLTASSLKITWHNASPTGTDVSLIHDVGPGYSGMANVSAGVGTVVPGTYSVTVEYFMGRHASGASAGTGEVTETTTGYSSALVDVQNQLPYRVVN